MALACACRHPSQRRCEFEFVTRSDLTAESSAVETSEQRQAVREPFIAENRQGSDLSDRFAHQHTRQCRTPRKVPREEPLLA